MAIDVTTAKRVRYDGLETQLGIALGSGVVTINFTTPLSADGGAPIASLVTGEYLPLSILDANYRLAEIVYLTAYDTGTTTGTIERGAEGTPANKSHPLGSKVVHAATVVDFTTVMDHKIDPNAHGPLLDQMEAYADGLMATHVSADDPHAAYAKKAGDTFTGNVTFGGTAKIVRVNGTLDVPVGATLMVEGDLKITGRFFLNGREIVASNNPPSAPSANTIYIQTFG